MVVRQIAPPDTLGGGVVLDPHPRKHGPGRETVRALERLARGERPPQARVARREPKLPASPEPLSATAVAVERRLREAGTQPPPDSELDADALAALRTAGRAVRVARGLHYHADVLADLRTRILAIAERRDGAVTLAQLRDELGTSRKFAQALLEHLDAEKVTVRRGDEHFVRGRARG
jgi:selenocysteine-specific elongation factor